MDAGATLIGAVIGAAITLVSVYIQHGLNAEAEKGRRAHDAKVRTREEGLRAAKDVLEQLNLIRTVFNANEKARDPSHELYEQHFHLARLYAIGIDDKSVADILDRICEVYWSSGLATELDEWSPRQLSNLLDALARDTVHAYIHGESQPDLKILQAMEAEIESNGRMWDERYEEERERVLAERVKERAQHELAQLKQQQLKDMGAMSTNLKPAPSAPATSSPTVVETTLDDSLPHA